MNFAFAHFYPENGCEYTSIFHMYDHTYVCTCTHTHDQVRLLLYFVREISSHRDRSKGKSNRFKKSKAVASRREA